MRTLQFLKKEALHLITAPETLLLMLLFPVLLTWVLGTAMSSMGTRTLRLPEMKMPLISEGGMMSDLFFANSNKSGITFEKSDQGEIDRRVLKGALKQYVELKGNEIILHSDNQGGLEAMMVKMYAAAFVKQANLATLAMREGKIDQLGPQFHSFARVEGVDGKNEPNSFGYYGVTMLTMIIMYGSLQAMSLLALEKYGRTALRLKASPYSMGRVFVVKMGAGSGIILLQALVLITVNHFVYGIDYRHIGMVLLMLVPLALFVTSLGVAVYQVMRNAGAASTLLNILTIAMVFMGRGYMMVSMDNAFFARLSRLSPIGWINEGLFEYIYQGQTDAILAGGIKLLALSLVMFVVAYVLFKREEGSDLVAAD